MQGSKNRRPEEWFRETVLFYRTMGFFDDLRSLSEDNLVRVLETRVDEAGWGQLAPAEKWADLHVIDLDESRVWWEDLEADVGEGNEIYVKTVRELASISRGMFTADNIVERWEGEEGPITVEFTARGSRYTVHPQYMDDWID